MANVEVEEDNDQKSKSDLLPEQKEKVFTAKKVIDDMKTSDTETNITEDSVKEISGKEKWMMQCLSSH